jgi:hypothetical protein
LLKNICNQEISKMKLIDCKTYITGNISGFSRMTTELSEFYKKPEKRKLRAECASGIRFEFLTDAQELTLGLKFGAGVRDIHRTDIQVEKYPRIFLNGTGPDCISLPGNGMRKVTIYPPHLVKLEAAAIKIPDDAIIASNSGKKNKILFCGDSILQGMTCLSPAGTITSLVADACACDFHNTAVGGACMEPEPVHMTSSIEGDLLIAGFGINDAIANIDIDLFRSKTVKVYERLADFQGSAFIIAPIPNLAGSTPRLNDYRKVIFDVSRDFPEVTTVDGYEMMPADPELYADKTHPNDKGAEIYAHNLSKIIKRSFK